VDIASKRKILSVQRAMERPMGGTSLGGGKSGVRAIGGEAEKRFRDRGNSFGREGGPQKGAKGFNSEGSAIAAWARKQISKESQKCAKKRKSG